MPRRILVTTGDPAGIGPDIVIALAQNDLPADLLVIADPEVLKNRANKLNLNLNIAKCDLNQEVKAHKPGTLQILPIQCSHPIKAGKLNPDSASYIIETLTTAANLCQQNPNWALVTGPVNKSLINQAGIKFSGHTEFFAQLAGVEKTVMLFVTESFKLALATTHLPLQQVADTIKQPLLLKTFDVLNEGLRKWFKIDEPNILVSGLNPHAGESGHLGHEEIDTIIPAIKQAQDQGFNIHGPFPADTLFTEKYLKQADCCLAMYHDQGLPIVKYASFGHAVNMTLGLPYLRTSVDHGTAYDIAGSGKADPGSMIAAINLAIKLA